MSSGIVAIIPSDATAAVFGVDAGNIDGMPSPLDDLVTLLDLELIEVNIFRGQSPMENRQRIYGGQVAGQALVAASRTIDEPDRHVHSLHAYFLRPGAPGVPVVYEVDRIRDGKSFSTRRVVAIQNGKPIFNLHASFQKQEEGLEYQIEMIPDTPDPESFPDFHTRMAPHKEVLGDWYYRPRPIDQRYVDGNPMTRANNPLPGQRVWFRADGTLPDDEVLHACIVAYASDSSLLDTALLPHGRGWIDGSVQMASLDHAMWFHRKFRADEWLLYQQKSISTSGSRGLAEGHIFTRDGRLAVTVVQEGLTRLMK